MLSARGKGTAKKTRSTQSATNLARCDLHRLLSRALLELHELYGGGDQSLPLLPTSTPLWSRNDNFLYQSLLLLHEFLRPEFFPFLVAFSEGRHGRFEQGAVFGVESD